MKDKILALPSRRLQIFALGALAIVVNDAALGAYFLFADQRVLGWAMIGTSVGISLLLPMLFMGFHTVPRVLVPYVSLATMSLIAAYYGSQVNVLYTAFIGAIYPFLCFSSKEKIPICLTLPVPILFILGMEFLDFGTVLAFIGAPPAPELLGKQWSYLILFGSLFLVGASCYFFSNISETFADRLNEAVTRLTDANQRSRRLNDELNNFVRIICHDIANPVMIIELSLGKKQQIVESDVVRVKAALTAIRDIIENVRTLQTLGSKSSAAKGNPVMMKDVVADCQFLLGERHMEKNIRLEVEFDDWVNENPIHTNRKLLSQNILSNILTNAVKFSPQGSTVKIYAGRHRSGDVVIRVSDRGIGIPKEMIEDLFIPGQHKSRLGTSDESGSGFGLAIAKNCVKIIGGDITVNSRSEDEHPDDHGTDFEVHLKAS